MKYKIALLVIILLLSTFFLSCAKNEYDEEWEPPKKEEGAQPAADGELEPEQRGDIKSIDFILMGYGTSGQPRNKTLIETILAELNKRLAEEINAEASFTWAPYETYEESVMEMLAAESGIDSVDIMYQNSTVFSNLLGHGMLMDIKDDFRLYMPETYKFLHEKYAYIDDYLLTGGAQYIIPKINAYPLRGYIITQKEIYNEYGRQIETLEDYEDYMQWISESKPDMTPGYAAPIEAIDIYLNGHGYAGYSATSFYSPLEAYGKVVPMERVPEFRDVYEMLARWKENDYQGKILPGGQFRAAETGKLASMLVNPTHSQSDEQAISLPTNIEYEYIVLYKNTRILSVPSFDGPGILKDADAEAELLKFYELIYTRQDLYDIVHYGIEGENYIKVGEKLTMPEDSNKVIRGWFGSDNFYNYSMERPLWSEPEDFALFFEETAFYNTVTHKELAREFGLPSKASDISEETMEEMDTLYEEGIGPLLDLRFEIYFEFIEKLGMGDYSMSVEEAIEMLDEGNTQELVDIYAEIAELYEKAE